MGVYSGGLYTEGLIFGRTFGLKGDLCMPKNSAFSVKSERIIKIKKAKYCLKRMQEERLHLIIERTLDINCKNFLTGEINANIAANIKYRKSNM